MAAAGAGSQAVAPLQVGPRGDDLGLEAPRAGAVLQLDDVEGVLYPVVRVDACTRPPTRRSAHEDSTFVPHNTVF